MNTINPVKVPEHTVQKADMRNHRNTEKTKKRRIQILWIAADVFGKEGSSKGTLEEIAHRAGLTRPGLLYYFGSKRNLITEVVQLRDHYDLQTSKKRTMPTDGDQMIAHLISTMKDNEQRPGIVRMFSVLSGEALQDENPNSTYFATRYASLREDIIHGLNNLAHKRHLTFNHQETVQAASSIIAVMDGLQIQWLHSPKEFRLADDSEFAIRSIVFTLLADAQRAQRK